MSNARTLASLIDGSNIVVPSGYGLDFSANANASGMTSEVLDDYEEGTWTPLLDGTSLGTLGGHYTKIGNRAVICFNNLASTSTITSGSGGSITGFPFVINPGSGASYFGGGPGILNWNDASDSYKSKSCQGRLTRPSNNEFNFTNESGSNIAIGDPLNFFVIMFV